MYKVYFYWIVYQEEYLLRPGPIAVYRHTQGGFTGLHMNLL